MKDTEPKSHPQAALEEEDSRDNGHCHLMALDFGVLVLGRLVTDSRGVPRRYRRRPVGGCIPPRLDDMAIGATEEFVKSDGRTVLAIPFS